MTPAWEADGKSFEYNFDGKRYRFDVAARQATPIGEAADAAGRGRGGRGQGAPERGRQYSSADSPDGTLRAPGITDRIGAISGSPAVPT